MSLLVWARTLVLLALMIHGLEGNHRNRLIEDLFYRSGYNKFAQTHSMEVALALRLQRVNSLDDKLHVLDSQWVLDTQWEDQGLVWDPRDYDNISQLAVPADKVWLPDLRLEKSLGSEAGFPKASGTLLVDHTGTVSWSPLLATRTACPMDATFYPFDTQHCVICISTETSEKTELSLTFDPSRDLVLSDYSERGLWRLAGSDTSLGNDSAGSQDVLCFSLSLQRLGVLAAVQGVVLPALGLALAAWVVVSLPVDTGQAMMASAVTFLAYAVYFAVTCQSLPLAASQVSLLDVYLLLLLGATAVSVLVSVRVFKSHHAPDTVPLSEATKQNVRNFKRMLHLQNEKSTSSDVDAKLRDVSSDQPDGPTLPEMDQDQQKPDITWPHVAKVMAEVYFVAFVFFLLALTLVLVLCWIVHAAVQLLSK